MKKPLLVIAGLAMTGLAACSSVPAGQQAVEVDSFGSPKVSGCVKEETQTGTFTVDLKRYPARAISWDANNDPGAERGPYLALSNPSAQAEMAIPVTITFDLTTDCAKLMDFHRNYGTKYNGWVDEESGTSDGWIKLITYTISQPAEQAVIAVTQKYPWQKVWNDETVRSEYKAALTAQLPKESAARTGGVEYFTNFQVTVGKPYPTNDQLRKSAEAQQANAAAAEAERIKLTSQADAERAAAESQRAAAEAQRAAEIAKANIVAAQIAGYGTGPEAVDAYLRAQCQANSNCHQYDPSPIIAGAR